MRKLLGGFCLLTALVVSSLAVPSRAATTPAKRVVTPVYDASKEVTLAGTVSSVKTSVAGKLAGAHLFLTSGTGTVDAHLGPFALNGPHGVKVSAGQQVKLVGVTDHASWQSGISSSHSRIRQQDLHDPERARLSAPDGSATAHSHCDCR